MKPADERLLKEVRYHPVDVPYHTLLDGVTLSESLVDWLTARRATFCLNAASERPSRLKASETATSA